MLTLLLITAILTTYIIFRFNDVEVETTTVRKTVSEPQRRR